MRELLIAGAGAGLKAVAVGVRCAARRDHDNHDNHDPGGARDGGADDGKDRQ